MPLALRIAEPLYPRIGKLDSITYSVAKGLGQTLNLVKWHNYRCINRLIYF